jgi:tetratricopeptide (TPR) repeat protein
MNPSVYWKLSLMAAVLAAFIVLSAAAPAAGESADAVKKAYELRMAGKAAEAKTLLEETIAADPENAAAHYELARTLIHMGLGDPSARGGLQEMVNKIRAHMDKAVELAPKNLNYAMFSAQMAFFNAYMSLHDDKSDAKEKVDSLCLAFEGVLQVDAECLTPMLHLVEIYGVLPDEMGGDKAKAEEYAAKLEAKDAILGAKARSILLGEDADRVAYWKKVLESHAGNADVLEELGKALLYDEKAEEGVAYLEKAVAADPGRTRLILDIARYHLLLVMQGRGSKEDALKAAEKAARRYLESDPIPPMRAYGLEILAKIKFGMEDKAAVEELRGQAAKIDPYYSRAFGVPGIELFISPDEVWRGHKYLFRPF